MLTAHLGLSESVSSLTRHNPDSSVTLDTTITVLSTCAGTHDADTIAKMVGDLLHDIMAAVNDKVFVFHHDDIQQLSTFSWCSVWGSYWEPGESSSSFRC